MYGLIPTKLTCATFPTTLGIPITATKRNIIRVRQSCHLQVRQTIEFIMILQITHYFGKEVNDESDSDGDYSYYGYGMGGDSRSISSHSSQQQQQQSDEIGLGGIVAGTAAVLAVGAAAFGLFAAFRQSRQNNQQ